MTLNEKEQKRLLVLNRVIGGQLTAGQAVQVLGLSLRQVRRIMAAYREEGAAAIAHGNRGRQPANRVESVLRERVVELARTKYVGHNFAHLRDRLEEEERIRITPSSLRRILLEAGVRSPRKRRAPKHRSRRERYAQEGMLLQVDGSRHDWLEGRGPYLTLVGAIDDATGQVMGGLFRQQEDAQGYFLLLRQIVASKGRPVAIYRDRHSIFEPTGKEPLSLEEQLAGRREPTQFGRLLEELEITSIAALSPQAKGRIERLWGTFQDRLVAEMRQAGLRTLQEANAFLPGFLARYNRRFAVPADQKGSAYRPLLQGSNLDSFFCFKYPRTVASDNTVRFGDHRLQLLASPDRASYARAKVEVQEHLDGSLAVVYQGKVLTSKPASMEAAVLRTRNRHGSSPQAAMATGRGDGSLVAAAVEAVDKWADSKETVHLSTANPKPKGGRWRGLVFGSKARG